MNLLENQQMAETIDSIYIDLETQLMQNIARHLRDWDKPIDTDIWLMQKLAEIGKLNKENIRIIAQMSGLSLTAAERMLNEAAEEAIQSMEPGFRYLARRGLVEESVDAAKSKNVKQVMNSMRDQAKDSLNLTNTTMLYKAQKSFKTLVQETSKIALEIMNNNAAAVVTGAESRQQALRRTIKQFNEQGITGFVDKRGRNWTPEAYVNMCMRATSKNVAEEVQTARILDHGVNLILISSHSGARPKCAKDQGKIFDLNNESGVTEDLNGRKAKYYPWSSSSYGEPDGILGINCHHHKFPYIPGVSIQRYFPTEDMDANDRLYKQTQVQRALERDVRKQKRECMMFDTLGDKDAFENAAVKLKSKEAKLKNYVDTHDNLHRRKDREQVVGFDKRISAEAVAANKKKNYNYAENKIAKSVAMNNENDTIKVNTDYLGIPKKWKTIDTEQDDPLKKSNPKYSIRKREYAENCYNCVCAYEMRKRGYDVIAKPATSNRHLSKNPFDAWKDPVIKSANGHDDIVADMKKWPDGSRAEIAVTWKGSSSGHVFIAEKRNEKVYYYDPQNGGTYTESIFKQTKQSETKYCRIDNLEPSDRGITACKGGE